MKVGDKIWFLASRGKQQAIIKKINRSDAIIQFVNGGGGIRISVNRLFSSEEEIDEFIRKKEEKEVLHGLAPRRKNQYDYMV